MRSAREALHQLDLLVLLAEPLTSCIGPFLAEHLPLLSVVLGLTVHEVLALSSLADEILVFYLGPALRQHRARQKQVLQDQKTQRVSTAGQQLRERVRWSGDRAALDVDLLLGPLVQGAHKILVFASPAFEVGLPRGLLRETAKVLGPRRDVTAFVDPKGLHFRWNQGKGRLDFFPQPRLVPGPDLLVVQLGALPPGRSSALAAE